MSTKKTNHERAHKLAELIDYYEVYNKAEGKSNKTISWYSDNLKRFRGYVVSRHRTENINSIDTKFLREYILYLMSRHRYENHPNNPPTCRAGINRFFSNRSSGTVPNSPPFRSKGKTFEKTFPLVF